MKSSTVSALTLAATLLAAPAFAQEASPAQQSGPNLDELTDTLERSKSKGVLTGCAYPYGCG